MIYRKLQHALPGPVRRYVLHFEAVIEDAVRVFSYQLAEGTWVLDAGAGEGTYRSCFTRQSYIGVDLGIGDAAWNYSELDAVADLQALPFRSGTFDAAVNIVTLEHVREPACVLAELSRVLRTGGRLLLVVPHEWEEHQQPHDFFRYTRYGVRHLLERAGFSEIRVEPVGGYFRLLSRRLLNGIQFFPGPLAILAGLLLGPPALIAPLFDGLDRNKNFTLGFVCSARKI